MRTIKLISLSAAVVASGCAEKESSSEPAAGETGQVTVAEVATNFTAFSQMTEGEVFVNPELAMLCVGASEKMVKEAADKHGPHANTSIRIFMNDSASAAFEAGTEPFPVGAVIVKQKAILGFREEASREWVRKAENGVGGMIKRPPGYDSANGDWEYFYFEDQGEIESGKIQSCIDCHQEAKSTDFVFGSWFLKSAG